METETEHLIIINVILVILNSISYRHNFILKQKIKFLTIQRKRKKKMEKRLDMVFLWKIPENILRLHKKKILILNVGPKSNNSDLYRVSPCQAYLQLIGRPVWWR
jgi:hypothetical protein